MPRDAYLPLAEQWRTPPPVAPTLLVRASESPEVSGNGDSQWWGANWAFDLETIDVDRNHWGMLEALAATTAGAVIAWLEDRTARTVLMARLLPPVAAVAETFEDVVGATLLGDEEVAVKRAVAKRRREFATGRHCARRALRSLGRPPAAIGSGRHGEPLWPPGVVGSITHCAGYRGCALATTDNLPSIGIDAEPHEALPEGVLASIATSTERRQVRDLGRQAPEIHWDRLLFSAKECVYKAWFPLTRRRLDFANAEVSIDCDDGKFSARLLVPGPMLAGGELTTLSGRWLVCNGLVATAIAVAPAQP